MAWIIRSKNRAFSGWSKLMTRILRLLFLCISVAVNMDSLHAQWVQTNGPYGGDITCFAMDSTTIFAGAYSGGVFQSTNNGQSWTATKGGLINTNTLVLAADGMHLYAGTEVMYGGGLFVSTNNGASWTASGLALQGVNVLAIRGKNLFAGSNGLFLSTNNGTSWDTVLPSANITALALDSANLFVGAGYSGVYRSTDNGTSWTSVDSGLTGNIVTALAISPVSGGASSANLFAGTLLPVPVPVGQVPVQPYTGIYRSTNYGESWAAVDSGLRRTIVSVFAVKDTNIFAGTSRGVFLSTNEGSTWAQMNTGLTDTNINALVVKGPTLFAGTSNGIFISTNNGASWTAASTGVTSTSISALGVFGSNLFVGDNGIQLSTDNGNSWLAVDSGISSNTYVDALAMSPASGGAGSTNLFAGMEYQSGILRSTNNATSWTLLDSGLTNAYITCLAVSPASGGANSTNLFAGDGQGGHGVFLSTNNGTSWTAVDSGMGYTWVLSLAVSPTGNGATNIFAGTQNGGVFHSTNNGKSWTLPSTLLSTEIVYALGVEGTNLFAGTGEGVFLSTDNGTSWTAAGLTNANVSALAISGTNIFAGTIYTGVSNGGIFLSTDNGTSWRAVNTGLTNTNISSLAVSETDLYAGTNGSGTWRRPLSDMITAVKESKNEIPTTYSLSQNYPNPFNPSTTISFALPSRSFVSLKVFDILGRELSTIVSGELQAGTYNRQWNAANMSSGVYFYRLQAGSFIETKKLLLLK